MGKCYQIARSRSRRTQRIVNDVLVEHGQAMMPLVELIESGQLMIEEFMANVGQAVVEAVLEMSVQNLAGASHQGSRGGPLRRYGRQQGTVCLASQKLQVGKPCLRRRDGGEVAVSADEALRSNAALNRQVSRCLLHGVSTRN